VDETLPPTLATDPPIRVPGYVGGEFETIVVVSTRLATTVWPVRARLSHTSSRSVRHGARGPERADVRRFDRPSRYDVERPPNRPRATNESDSGSRYPPIPAVEGALGPEFTVVGLWREGTDPDV